MSTTHKIILATGIFFPNVGGPATHVRRIAEALHAEGTKVTVVAYGDYDGKNPFPFEVVRISRKNSAPIRGLRYLYAVLKHGIGAHKIYAFDPTAAGMPAFVAAKMLFVPYMIRIGGDPIWERVVEKGQRFMSLDEYYKQGLAKVDKPRTYLLIKLFLKFVPKIVVYNQMIKDLYVNYFGIPAERFTIIPNPMMARRDATPVPFPPVFLFAGRFVAYKNLPLVIKSFDSLYSKYKTGKLVLIGSGPDEKDLRNLISSLASKDQISMMPSLPQEELFAQMKSATVCIAPALSEFNPNFVLEGISMGRPAIISKGHGLTVKLPDEWHFDPTSFDSLKQAMEQWYDEATTKSAATKVAQIPLTMSWDDTVSANIKLIHS